MPGLSSSSARYRHLANSSAKNLPDLLMRFFQAYLPLEYAEGGMLFSYQNRSDFLEI